MWLYIFFIENYLGIVSTLQNLEFNYKWPSHICKTTKEANYYVNVGEYAKSIWEIIRKDGGDECQTEVEW